LSTTPKEELKLSADLIPHIKTTLLAMSANTLDAMATDPEPSSSPIQQFDRGAKQEAAPDSPEPQPRREGADSLRLAVVVSALLLSIFLVSQLALVPSLTHLSLYTAGDCEVRC
jgi:hypothetical protein